MIAWDELMAFGFGVLRMSPADFWRMTLKELGAVVKGMAPRREGIERAALEEMMRRYPDGTAYSCSAAQAPRV